ncbi:MAG: 50S ribosomal protein L20 [Alphaproteobacteria bacterium]|nr:50S ribosomal protein L20 [Alphaproteobacteria bacterium]
MARVKRGETRHARHKKVLARAKGYRGSNSKIYRVAVQKTEKAMLYAYRDRRVKKRDFRSLWIVRINAAVRSAGMTYSQFMHAVKAKGIALDRKMLANMAMTEPAAFAKLVESVKS